MNTVSLIFLSCIFTGCAALRNADELRRGFINTVDIRAKPESQTVISTTFVLTSLIKLETVSQELSTTFRLYITWTDKRLTWEPQDEEPTDLVFDVNEIWTPPLVVGNAVGDGTYFLKDHFSPPRVYDDGRVTSYTHISSSTSCNIDLSNFPVDNQTCDINITSWIHTESELDLVSSPTSQYTESANKDLPDDQVWNITDVEVKSQIVIGFFGRKYKSLQYILHFRRHERYYWVMIVIPFICISTLMCLALPIPSQYQETKINYSLTLLLSFMLFLVPLQSLLPPAFSELKQHILGEYVGYVMGFGTAIIILSVLQLVVGDVVKGLGEKTSVITGTFCGIALHHTYAVLSGTVEGDFTDGKEHCSCERTWFRGKEESCCDQCVNKCCFRNAWFCGRKKNENGDSGRIKGAVTVKPMMPNPDSVSDGQASSRNRESVNGKFDKRVYVYTADEHSTLIRSDIDVKEGEVSIMNFGVSLSAPSKMLGPFKGRITGYVVNNEIREGKITGSVTIPCRKAIGNCSRHHFFNIVLFVIFLVLYGFGLGNFLLKVQF